MEKLPYKKALLIGDIHWGCHSNSSTWVQIIEDFFEKEIPRILDQNRDIDWVFFFGDIFDNRQSLSVLIMNKTVEVFQKLAKRIPIGIILGNHDIYYKNTNQISSIRVLENIPNIRIWSEPQVLSICDKSLFLMPWRKDHNEDRKTILETLKKHSSLDYLFCHTDFQKFNYNAHIRIEDGNEGELVSDIKRVISGHIHWRQEKGNILLLGTPYEITRGDIGNGKGCYILDFRTDGLEFVKNNISPIHLKLNYSDVIKMDEEGIKNLIRGNFVDVYYTDDIRKSDLRKFTEKSMPYCLRLELIPHHFIEENSTHVEYEKSMSILEICNDFIDFNYKDHYQYQRIKKALDFVYKNSIATLDENFTN